MRRRSVALAIAAAVLALAGGSPASVGHTVTFRDALREQAGAPDLRAVTVSQRDDILTVEAKVVGMPAILDPGGAVFLLDTGATSGTNMLRGAEYVLDVDWSTMQGPLLRWDGRRYVPAKKVAEPSRTLIGGGSVGFIFNVANFGYPKRFDLSVAVRSGQPESGLVDAAPDEGAAPWRFSMTPTMTSFDLTFAPTRPRAGAPFAGGTPKLTLSDRRVVVPSAYTCRATLAGARLAGAGPCRWQLPRGASGKRLVVSATASYRGETAEFGDWTFRVR